jgi:hypothetical protein
VIDDSQLWAPWEWELEAPCEAEAKHYGITAARLLWSVPVRFREECRRVLDHSLARGESQQQALEQLISRYVSAQDFGIPRRPQPKAYAKTRHRQIWGERCVELIESLGLPQAKVVKDATIALTQKRLGEECTIPEFADLSSDLRPRPSKPPRATESMIRRLIRKTRRGCFT